MSNSRDFVNELPEHLRHIYSSAPNPTAARVEFETRQQVEEIIERKKRTSNIFKIFGDNIFGYMEPDGTFTLDVRMINKNEYLREYKLELERLYFTRQLLLNDGATCDTVSKTGEPLHFNKQKLLKILNDQIEDAAEAARDINAKIENGYTYMNKEALEMIRAIEAMRNAFKRPILDHSHYLYLDSTVRMTAVGRSVNDIFWARELYSLRYQEELKASK